MEVTFYMWIFGGHLSYILTKKTCRLKHGYNNKIKLLPLNSKLCFYEIFCFLFSYYCFYIFELFCFLSNHSKFKLQKQNPETLLLVGSENVYQIYKKQKQKNYSTNEMSKTKNYSTMK